MDKKNNIIFIHTDSMDGRLMGCMGEPALKGLTPNLDRLASKGALFKNAYSNNPICCPSRASMWSGQYTHHCEGWNNYKGLEPGMPTFGTELEKNGYNTGHFGKKDYLSGNHSFRARVTAWTRTANIKRPSYNEPKPVIKDNNEKRVHQSDWKAVEKGINWIENNVNDKEKPFMAYFGIRQPHPPFRTSRYYYNMIEENKIKIPPLDEESHQVMEYQKITKNWQYGFSDEIIKKVRRIYLAMIVEVDAMVGRILEFVNQSKLDENTYIIFSSDHGEMAMEHRQYYKMNFYEPSSHIPLIISGPGIQEHKQLENLVSLVDIYPTLMDMAGLDHPDYLDGYSLKPQLEGKTGEHPDWVLSEFHGTTMNTGGFMLRKGNWKYITYVDYKPQLFNLKEDPWEINNMAEKLPEKVEEMDELLRSIVDYEEVHERVKKYDKASFSQFRRNLKDVDLYEDMMSVIYSGGRRLKEEQKKPWTKEDEQKIKDWLNK